LCLPLALHITSSRRMTGAISDRKRRRENRVEWLPPVNHPGAPRVNSVPVHVSGWQSLISQIWRRDVGRDQGHHGCTTLYISVYLPVRCMELRSTIHHRTTSSWRGNRAPHITTLGCLVRCRRIASGRPAACDVTIVTLERFRHHLELIILAVGDGDRRQRDLDP
jgi:hypothetical protein